MILIATDEMETATAMTTRVEEPTFDVPVSARAADRAKPR